MIVEVVYVRSFQDDKFVVTVWRKFIMRFLLSRNDKIMEVVYVRSFQDDKFVVIGLW